MQVNNYNNSLGIYFGPTVSIPNELICHILLNLDFTQFSELAQISKKWNALISDPMTQRWWHQIHYPPEIRIPTSCVRKIIANTSIELINKLTLTSTRMKKNWENFIQLNQISLRTPLDQNIVNSDIPLAFSGGLLVFPHDNLSAEEVNTKVRCLRTKKMAKSIKRGHLKSRNIYFKAYHVSPLQMHLENGVVTVYMEYHNVSIDLNKLKSKNVVVQQEALANRRMLKSYLPELANNLSFCMRNLKFEVERTAYDELMGYYQPADVLPYQGTVFCLPGKKTRFHAIPGKVYGHPIVFNQHLITLWCHKSFFGLNILNLSKISPTIREKINKLIKKIIYK